MGESGGSSDGGGGGEVGVDEMEEDEVITEYEKGRLRTIERNKAVFAALGLPALASSVAEVAADLVERGKQVKRRQKQVAEAGRQPKRRSQRLKNRIQPSNATVDSSSSEQSESECSGSPRRIKGKQRDKEYEPTDDETESDSDDSLHNSNGEEELPHSTPALPDNSDLNDEELALQQALALSMGTPLEVGGTGEIQIQSDWPSNKKMKVSKNTGVSEQSKDLLHSSLAPNVSGHPPRRRKQKNQGGRSQFTEGELDALFALFDDKGRGRLSVGDIAYVASAHDFTWSKDELTDMVEFFDSNQDGMLDIAEFRSLAARCNLILS